MKTFEVARKLNQLVKLDKSAVQKLISHRVKFDELLAASEFQFMLGTDFEMGLIGVINGLISDSENVIAAMFEKNTDGDVELVEFCVINPLSGERLEDVEHGSVELHEHGKS